MFGSSNSQQQDPNQMSAGDKHIAVMQALDEIKRYVAGIYSKVDTEIDEIRRLVDSVEKQVRETDRSMDKIDQIERSVRNLESTIREVERKVR